VIDWLIALIPVRVFLIVAAMIAFLVGVVWLFLEVRHSAGL
jgi:uncharacterized membrane protein